MVSVDHEYVVHFLFLFFVFLECIFSVVSAFYVWICCCTQKKIHISDLLLTLNISKSNDWIIIKNNNNKSQVYIEHLFFFSFLCFSSVYFLSSMHFIFEFAAISYKKFHISDILPLNISRNNEWIIIIIWPAVEKVNVLKSWHLQTYLI